MKRETIAAIATGLGSSGIGIVRISGADAFSITDQIFRAKSGRKISECKGYTIHYGNIVDGNDMIDEVLVMVMKGPHSYTAEDTIEINCHGGVLVTRNVLDTVIRYGARPAEPGEFTRRAFLNGRIDLSQSEAVIDVINSQNQFALQSSLQQLRGSLRTKIRELREKIIYEIAFIESALDDPEHISIDGYGGKLAQIVENILDEIEGLLKSSENGKLLKEGIHTVIVGKPNVGKSSLMNILVGEEKAIVTEIAGTTRDILEESVLLGGIRLHMMDTAGIRDAKDVVEKIGIDKAKQYIEMADLILYVVDASIELDKNDDEIIQMIKDKNVIVLLNKSDLVSKVSIEEMKHRLDKKMMFLSTKEETGIEQLEKSIQQMFFEGNLSFNDEVYITNARHKSELLNCKNSLQLVKQSIQDAMPEDFYSIDLMNAYEALGNIIGEAVEEDLVNKIFQEFCMGK